jgi:glucose/arabinose dehydrogenase
LNCSTPIGYLVTRVSLKDPGSPTYEVFAEGWLLGRPVYALEMPDGALLVLDDRVGAIYRISYTR